MKPDLQRRVQRYGWDKASKYYEKCWQEQLKPAHDILLKKANIRPSMDVLDIAAGTGLITFRMAETVGLDGNILATDISDEMVKIGAEFIQCKNLNNVSFVRMNAENLICTDNSFNVVTCALGLMYFPEPDVSLKEMYRVLKYGGHAVVAVWGSRKKCGWSEIFPIVDERVNTDVCPMFFNLGEGQVLKYTFEKAGFKNISLVKITTKLCYSSAKEACEASFLGGPVAMAYARFNDTAKNEAKNEYIASIEIYKTDNGYEIPGEFVICSGTK